MRGLKLTTPQINQLCDSLRPKLDYLTRLRTRMEQTHFPKEVTLYQKVYRAQHSTYDLVAELDHMLSMRAAFG